MDISKERLGMIHSLAERYKKETKADLRFEATTDRKKALQGTDFVVCTVKVGGYEPMETERKIAERYGYYRGIGERVSDYYGGIGAYHQLRFFLDLATDMEDLCPDAWLIETANPVFEGTNLVTRETRIKAVGVCHGHSGYKQIAELLGLSIEDVGVQVAGFNHCIWMTHFLHKGRDAYPLIDDWIEKEAEDFWKSDEYLKSPSWEVEQVCPGAVDMYRNFGLFPIGDTVRSVSPWWHHTDLKTKQKWYGPSGGFDSEIGWAFYLDMHGKILQKMNELYRNQSLPLTKEVPPESSGEQHIAVVDAIENDKEVVLQLNIPNRGAVSGIPDDVVVEIPAVVSGRGIQGVHVGGLPARLMSHVMIPRMRRMEQILQAFVDGDRRSLVLMLMEDPRTKSFEQARRLIDELLSQPWNSEAAKHYK